MHDAVYAIIFILTKIFTQPILANIIIAQLQRENNNSCQTAPLILYPSADQSQTSDIYVISISHALR